MTHHLHALGRACITLLAWFALFGTGATAWAQFGQVDCSTARDPIPCDDGDPCTTKDTCQPYGRCVGQPVTCRALACRAGTCDADAGGCVYQPLSDGTVCSDGDPCTLDDQCEAGVCAGLPVDSCDPDCTTPTVAQCNDSAFPSTGCGEVVAATGGCAEHCQYDTALDGGLRSSDGSRDGTSKTREPPEDRHRYRDCGNTAWLESFCGQAEWARWQDAIDSGDLSRSACAEQCASFDANGTLRWDCRPEGQVVPVLKPGVMVSGDGETATDAAQVVDAFQPSIDHLVGFEGGHGSFEGFWRRYADPKLGFGLRLQVLQWHANGTLVTNCREYVYEKYWDWSLFKRHIVTNGYTYRAMVNTAYTAISEFIHGFGTVEYAAEGAIGIMGILGQPITSRDGTVVPRQPRLTGEYRRKNLFFGFATDLPRPDNSLRPDDFWPETVKPHLPDAAFTGCGGYPLIWVGCDGSLMADIDAGYGLAYQDNWQWHRDMDEALRDQGYIDEHLYRLEFLKSRLQNLLYERHARVQAILDLLTYDGELPTEQMGLVGVFAPEDVVGQPTDILAALSAGSDLRHSGAFTSSLLPALSYAGQLELFSIAAGAATDVTGVGSASTDQLMANAALTGAQVSAGAYAPASAETAAAFAAGSLNEPLAPAPIQTATDAARDLAIKTVSPFTTENFTTTELLYYLQGHLMETDARIEVVLQEARDQGCLDADKVTPCDWTPAEFGQTLRNTYEVDMEQDFDRCLMNTTIAPIDALGGWTFDFTINNQTVYPQIYAGDGFGDPTVYTCMLDADGELYVDTDENGPWGFPNCVDGPDDDPIPDCVQCSNCNRWNQSTSHLDLYFRCLDAYKKLVLQTMQEVGALQRQDGKLELGHNEGESAKEGNSKFNAFYAYNFGWAVAGFDTLYDEDETNDDLCDLSPQVWGFFEGGATLFGKKKRLIHASGNVKLGPKTSSLRPGDVKSDRLVFEVLGKSIVDESTDFDEVFSFADKVEKSKDFFKAKIPFSIGPVPCSLSFGMTGYLGLAWELSGSVNGESCPIMKGVVRPYTGVRAFASVAVDIVVASIGVKISLTLLELQLPLTTVAELKVVDGEGKLVLTTTLDLIIKTLGGYFAIFVETIIDTWEIPIFGWDGLMWVINLDELVMDIDLFQVADIIKLLEGAGTW